ncbi:HdeD family acid-resistance protein [Geomonas sp. RF6]|uniref:HdeD family acid-resistance protein n=1 Tax=Geomonas sp. RF6 TaxID=2897342 RepID=UPI001E3C69F2|nr:HdeD family acid-resistance protein [Geomonas sp. RF6]UFS68600.1 HdeD family acid-resistance protein [Geomonas sp. RF6]
MPRTMYDRKFFPRQLFSRTPGRRGGSYRGWLLTLGILFVLLGVIGLAMAFLVTLATTVAFGVLFLAGGVAQSVHAFSVSGWKERGLYLLMGVLYLVAGLAVIFNPLAASAVFTFILALVLVVLGVCRIAFAIRNRGQSRWEWPLMAGNLSILIGIMIMLQWPLSGLWVLGLLVSLEMIFHGWSFMALPLFGKRGESR